MRWSVSVLLVLTGCVRNLSMLEPRPNLPPAREPTIKLVVDERVAQEQRLFRLVISTFRGDLKRGFFNGYPGAATNGELTLVLDSVEPSYDRVEGGDCEATLRYRGRLLQGDTVLDAFAGSAVSPPSDLKLCFKRAIEKLYEQVYAKQLEAAP